jgi:hypothetical protein
VISSGLICIAIVNISGFVLRSPRAATCGRR